VNPLTKLDGVTENVIVGLVNILVVTPLETLSIGLPVVSEVVIVNELVVKVVLGFYKPFKDTVNGVPILVYALEKASAIVTDTGPVDVT
jgi:hypothetical protein